MKLYSVGEHLSSYRVDVCSLVESIYADKIEGCIHVGKSSF